MAFLLLIPSWPCISCVLLLMSCLQRWMNLIVALCSWVIVPCPDQDDDLLGTVPTLRHDKTNVAWNRKNKQIVHLLYNLPKKTSEFQMLCLNVTIRKFIKFIFHFCYDPVCLHSWFQEELCVTKLCICRSHYFIHWTIKAGLASYSWTFISCSKWYFIIFVNWSYLTYTLLDHPVILKGSFLLHGLHFVLQCKKISI